MQVFSLEKFKASNVEEELKQSALKYGWPQKSDGMTREEFGICWSESWAVEKEEWLVSKQDTATIKGSKPPCNSKE